MRRILYFVLLCTAVLLLVSCSTERTVEPDFATQTLVLDREQAAAELVNLAGWVVEEADALPQSDPKKSLDLIVAFEEEYVADGIVHYYWEVQVGIDPQDRIGLHRVVKEGKRGPAKTRKAVFLQHGDAKNFRGMFLPGTLSTHTPDDWGAAIWWAQRDVDVWGIDQAWNLVPADETNFDYMADWGITKQAEDLGTGVALARLARLATGNGFAKMLVAGYSSGGGTGYALANAETQMPYPERQMGGWIPVDYAPFSDMEDWREIANCIYIEETQAAIDAGKYGYFVGFDFFGVLARDFPDDPSDFFPGMTNLQVALFFGAGQIFGVQDIHYLAGVWEGGMPVDLVYTTVPEWIDFMCAGSPWEPNQFILDYYVWGCMEEDVIWDDYIDQITIPVLNVDAIGGIGVITDYCLSLLGSDDITDLNISLESEENRLYDYGHIDLWIGYNAPELVWEPMLQWIVEHCPGPGHKPAVAHKN